LKQANFGELIYKKKGKIMYTATKNWGNGTTETKEFDDYDVMCDWLSESPEAGISALTEIEDVNQKELQDDVSARIN
jgi:hypothetical protein